MSFMREAAARREVCAGFVQRGLSEEASQKSQKKFGSLAEGGRLEEWEEGRDSTFPCESQA